MRLTKQLVFSNAFKDSSLVLNGNYDKCGWDRNKNFMAVSSFINYFFFFFFIEMHCFHLWKWVKRAVSVQPITIITHCTNILLSLIITFLIKLHHYLNPKLSAPGAMQHKREKHHHLNRTLLKRISIYTQMVLLAHVRFFINAEAI